MSKKPFRAVPAARKETSSERRKRQYSYSSRLATPETMAFNLGLWAVTLHELSNGTSELPAKSWVRVISTNNYTYNVTTDSCPCCHCTMIFRNVEPHWLDFSMKHASDAADNVLLAHDCQPNIQPDGEDASTARSDHDFEVLPDADSIDSSMDRAATRVTAAALAFYPPTRIWTKKPLCPYCQAEHSIEPRSPGDFENKEASAPIEVTCQGCQSRFELYCDFIDWKFISPRWTSVGVSKGESA